jgi:quinohemoprotein ethanol dehydrogenase
MRNNKRFFDDTGAFVMFDQHQCRSAPWVVGVMSALLSSLPSCPTWSQGETLDAEASRAALLDGSVNADWPAYGRTYGEQHYSPLTQINDTNVSGLALAWYMDLGAWNPATQPLEVDGTLYFVTGLSIIHAVDARSGTLRWRFDPKTEEYVGHEMRVSWGIRGIAWRNGKIYTGTVDGRLIALDAHSGKLLWSVQTTEKGSGQYISGAPRVIDDKIIIGQGGADSSRTRGFVTAYDAESGRLAWRFYIVPGNPAAGFENAAMKMAAGTWRGEWWKWGGGGEPWNAFAFDAGTHTVFIGTGNGFPWNRRFRSAGAGDNLFLCSIVALDATTGQYKWHFQVNPGEEWDYNASMDMELADLEIAGRLRKVLLTAPKNGFFYVLDRITGQFISAAPIAKVTWASGIDPVTGRPIEVADARYPHGKTFDMWPSVRGAHSWMPMAYSPKTRLAYVPKIEHGLSFNDQGIDADHMTLYGLNVGPLTVSDALDNTSELLAWDPVAQKAAWHVPTFAGWNGGVLATAGNLVFQGQLTGRFSAYAADRGKELWHFDARAPILAAPISYSVGNVQFVTVMVGMGTSAGVDPSGIGTLQLDSRRQAKRVLTFSLNGNAHLPAPTQIPSAPKAFEDPDYHDDPETTRTGAKLFGENCLYCHGPIAIAAGTAPDLRTSQLVLPEPSFTAIVKEGVLVRNGMPRFEEFSAQDLHAIREYLRSRAAQLRPPAN